MLPINRHSIRLLNRAFLPDAWRLYRAMALLLKEREPAPGAREAK